MKSNVIKIAFVAAIALVAGINVYKAQKTEPMSDVAMANVEALASDESGTGSCSRAKVRVGCYRDNKWVCTRVKEIEYYDVVPGSMVECTHVQITECPSGCEER